MDAIERMREFAKRLDQMCVGEFEYWMRQAGDTESVRRDHCKDHICDKCRDLVNEKPTK